MASTHPADTIAGTVTSWLPVTTAYPYTSKCASVIFGTNLAEAWDPRAGAASIANIQCYPPEVTASYHQSSPANGGTVYSLGPFVCPESFKSTLATTAGTTTHYICCPPNFTCIAGDAVDEVTCTSLATPGQVLTLYPQSTDTFTLLTTTVSTTSVVGGVYLDAYLFGSMTTSASPSSSSASSTSLSFANTTLVTSLTSTQTSSTSQGASATSVPPLSSDLTTGTKIAIGISVPLAVAGVAALIVALLLYRKMHRQVLQWKGENPDQPANSPLELSSAQLGDHNMHDLGCQPRAELADSRYR